MKSILIFTLIAVLVFCSGGVLQAETNDLHEPSAGPDIRIGFIGSLSSFAASYGTAALRGVELAVEEARKDGKQVTLLVEDDASDAKQAVAAFHKLALKGDLDLLVTGTWWANAIAPLAASRKFPMISIETLYDKGSIPAPNYFFIQGDLKTWVLRFEDTVAANGYKRGAIVRFASGFGETLAEGTRELFSRPGREFVGDLIYSDISAQDTQTLILKLRQLKPDAVYIDAQPGGLAVILRRMAEASLYDIPIFTNEVANVMCQTELYDCTNLPPLYFTKRPQLSPDFEKLFESRYGSFPERGADLAYYSTKNLIDRLNHGGNLVTQLQQEGIVLAGKQYRFDSNNVLQELPLEVVRR